jgi:cell division protein FtsW
VCCTRMCRVEHAETLGPRTENKGRRAMARTVKSDRVLFFTSLTLVGISVAMVYSASAVVAMERQGQANFYLIKQTVFALVGLIAMWVAMNVDYTIYRRFAVAGALLGLAVLALILVLVLGPKVNGARRWFSLGPLRMQPSELAKLAMVFFTAMVLERRMDRIDEVRYALLPVVSALGVVALLVLLEPDLGTTVTIVGVVAAMTFAAGLPYRALGGLALGALPALAYLVVSEGYRLRRLVAFMRPEDDPLGDSFQLIQSLIAVGTGGIWGRGLGEGVQKLFYLPFPHTDFIFAVIGEELGLVGATLILACFAVIMWRGLRVARQAPDRFGALVALGLTMMIAAQAFVNISIVLGLLPTKGLPLPLVSAGGSSLIVSLAGMGVLLNISQHALSGEWE